jgi:hypothetical protein
MNGIVYVRLFQIFGGASASLLPPLPRRTDSQRFEPALRQAAARAARNASSAASR